MFPRVLTDGPRTNRHTAEVRLGSRPQMDLAPPHDEPIPLNWLQCGELMSFYDERYEPDEQGQPDHVRIYFCNKHGFFHFSETKQLTAGL